MIKSTSVLVIAAAGAALLLGACSSAPKRQAEKPPAAASTASTPVARPTAAPTGNPPIMEQMDNLINEMVQRLATSLPNQPEVRDSAHSWVLAASDVGVTGFADPGRYQDALRTIVGRLMKNESFSNSFVVVSTDQQQGDAFLRSISGGQNADYEDPAQRGKRAGKAQYDPRYVYFLSGRFFQVEEGGSRMYALHIDVDKPIANQRVLTESIERRYVWDAGQARWILAR